MTIHLDGIGEDWVVTRRPGGKPEISTYTSLDDLQRVLLRALAKSSPSALTRPVVTAEARRSPTMTMKNRPAAVDQETVGPSNGAAPPIEQDPEPEFDCTTCGACCAPANGTDKTHVLLDRSDKLRLGRRLPIMRKPEGHFLRTKMREGVAVCTALSGDIGFRCTCTIYDERPLVCQLFEVGGAECLKARERLKLKA